MNGIEIVEWRREWKSGKRDSAGSFWLLSNDVGVAEAQLGAPANEVPLRVERSARDGGSYENEWDTSRERARITFSDNFILILLATTLNRVSLAHLLESCSLSNSMRIRERTLRARIFWIPQLGVTS